MGRAFDDSSLDLECPQCGKTTTVTVAAIRRRPVFSCQCGETQFDGKELLRDLVKLNRDLAKMSRSITIKI